MGRAKPVSEEELLERIVQAGISEKNKVKREPELEDDKIDKLSNRIQRLLSINDVKRDKNNMLFFVMYDIESNKVRGYIAKYLIKMGCYRVQKSIFLADLPHESVSKIKSDLAQVQAAYDNNDSILIVPISTDYLKSMKIIGQNIDIDLIMKDKNTLFF